MKKIVGFIIIIKKLSLSLETKYYKNELLESFFKQ